MQKQNLPKWILKPKNKSYVGMIHSACTKFHLPKKIREKLINRFHRYADSYFSFEEKECLNPELLALKEMIYLKKKTYLSKVAKFKNLKDLREYRE